MNQEKNFIFESKVMPGRGEFSVKYGSPTHITTKSPAEKNKANLEIIKNLEKLFQRNVKIVAGQKSNKKTICVYNIDGVEAEKLLKNQ